MSDFLLRNKLKGLCDSQSTLLWLEGARHERVLSVKLSGNRLVVHLANGATRVMMFDKFSTTAVGLQFWAQGRACVLYKWEQVPKSHFENIDDGGNDDHEPPPGMAA